jgi:hypothetical protein
MTTNRHDATPTRHSNDEIFPAHAHRSIAQSAET